MLPRLRLLYDSLLQCMNEKVLGRRSIRNVLQLPHLHRRLYDPGAQLVIDDRRVLRVDSQIDMRRLPKPLERFMKPKFSIFGVNSWNSFGDESREWKIEE